MLHELRQLRKLFADLDSGDGGADRTEIAMDISAGFGLGIEGIHVTGTAVHPEQDARLRPGTSLRQRLLLLRRGRKGTQPAGKGSATDAGGEELEEFAAARMVFGETGEVHGGSNQCSVFSIQYSVSSSR